VDDVSCRMEHSVDDVSCFKNSIPYFLFTYIPYILISSKFFYSPTDARVKVKVSRNRPRWPKGFRVG